MSWRLFVRLAARSHLRSVSDAGDARGCAGLDCRFQFRAPGRIGLDRGGHLTELEQLVGRAGREHVHETGDDSRPAGLVAGSEPRAVVAVEVLVEEDEIAPV